MEAAETHTELPIALREMRGDDRTFILSSWLQSYLQSSFARGVFREIYFKKHQELIERLLRRSRLILAVDPEDDSHLYGYICADLSGMVPVIHYVYVKHAFRKFGLAKTLFSELKIEGQFFVSHLAPIVQKISGRGFYSPYTLMEIRE